ncbi:MAG: hypothetical protein CMH50_13175 [Myxococcales bacterium]|nr:hypothetical protein [Myxococcales bacterium]
MLCSEQVGVKACLLHSNRSASEGQRLSTMFQHQAGNKPEPAPVPPDLLPLLDRFRADNDGTGDGES